MSVKRALRSSTQAISETPHPQSVGSRVTNAKVRARGLGEKSNLQDMETKPEAHDLASSNNEPSTPPAKRARLHASGEVVSKAQDAICPPRSLYIADDARLDAIIPLDRPAEPHRTNAPLKTPRGSRLVTYPTEAVDSSPSKTGIPRPTTTTANILKEASAHLIKLDPRLQPLVEKHHCHMFSSEGLAEEIDPFQSLCSGIIAQQVSTAAAAAIKNRFMGLFHASTEPTDTTQEVGTFPQPAQVAGCDVTFLRSAGLSGRKAEYIKGLAEKFVDGKLSAAILIKASDEEVLETLTAVRGLGKWSVEMFSCFGLKRMVNEASPSS